MLQAGVNIGVLFACLAVYLLAGHATALRVPRRHPPRAPRVLDSPRTCPSPRNGRRRATRPRTRPPGVARLFRGDGPPHRLHDDPGLRVRRSRATGRSCSGTCSTCGTCPTLAALARRRPRAAGRRQAVCFVIGVVHRGQLRGGLAWPSASAIAGRSRCCCLGLVPRDGRRLTCVPRARRRSWLLAAGDRLLSGVFGAVHDVHAAALPDAAADHRRGLLLQHRPDRGRPVGTVFFGLFAQVGDYRLALLLRGRSCSCPRPPSPSPCPSRQARRRRVRWPRAATSADRAWARTRAPRTR